MPYSGNIDALQILRAMLPLLDNTDYDGKDSVQIDKLKACIRDSMAAIELAARSSSSEKPEA